MDGTYIREIEEAIKKECLSFREEVNVLNKEYNKLGQAIEYWSSKILSTNSELSKKIYLH